MTLPLQIYIVRAPSDGTNEIYLYLQVETINANLIRNVSLINIPGDTNLALDLGMSAWEFELTGVCDNNLTAHVAPIVLSDNAIANFADFVSMRGWGTDYEVDLYFSASSYAEGKIRSITLVREAATEYWNFNMSFVIETLTVA